jgi:hypothetical protein
MGYRYRPLKAGVSIGRPYGNQGTICCFLKGKIVSKYYLLSCCHVVNGQTRLKTPIIQPARGHSSDDAVAEVITTIRLEEEGNLVDAAIAEILVKWDLEFKNELPDGKPINGTATAREGMDVKIIGARSNEVRGEIKSINHEALVRFGDVIRRFESQLLIRTDGPLEEGDSGAPVLTHDNKLVGIFFAYTSEGSEALANNIEIVLEKLNVKFYG